jgi:hypothetical protein
MVTASEIVGLVGQINIAVAGLSYDKTPALTPPTTPLPKIANHSELLRAAKSLVTALEDPDDAMWRFVMCVGAHSCCIFAWDCGLLDEWPKELMSLSDLTEKTKVEEKLLGM